MFEEIVSIDPMFHDPYIDLEEERAEPVPHHYVHGGFHGTGLKFSYYFPKKEDYKGRFFQFLAAAQGSENANQAQKGEHSFIGFAVSHGAYLVESNMGGPEAAGEILLKSNAAAAQYSREVAKRLYGDHRPYGYVSGGSGGSLKTCACFENTEGVWDGAVPFVIANPMAIPGTFCVRTHAMRVLRHKLPQIIDATDPGGGDMYEGLNPEEREALEEATKMGFPPRSWFAYYFMGDGSLPLLKPMLDGLAPNYYKDFWEKPGYLGSAEGGSAQRDRLSYTTKIKNINLPPVMKKDEFTGTGVDDAWHIFDQLDRFSTPPTVELESIPEGELYLQGTQVFIESGLSAGQQFPLGSLTDSTVTVGESFQPGLMETLQGLRPRDTVRLDNSDFIALQTFHRHQCPEGDFAGWRQFKDEKGESPYPQVRPFAGPLISMHGSGAVQTGRFKGKMIVLASLMDEAAFPWFADWYAKEVRKNYGDETDEHFRLWYMDHCMHAETPGLQCKLRVTEYSGALMQAMLDLSDWVERGIEPPASTNYKEVDAQIIVPKTAEERLGVQPVVKLLANGEVSVKVRAGDTVKFTAELTSPRGTSSFTKALFDFEGEGSFGGRLHQVRA